MGGMDLLYSFQIEGTPIQGRLVRLEESISTILRQHDYPFLIGNFLAELTTLTAALSGGLKGEEGLLTSQVKGEGPLRLMVCDATSRGHLRGFAQFERGELDSRVFPEKAGIPQLVGEGYLIMTNDPGPYGERYQGVVALEGKTLSECLQAYFRQSEQLAGALKVATSVQDGQWKTGALLLQKAPSQGGKASALQEFQKGEEEWELWYEALALLGSLSQEELLDSHLSAEDLLYRLFHQRGVRLFEPRPLRAQCRCSQQRVQDLVNSFSKEEKEDLCQNGVISVRCEFCNQEYRIPA